MAELSVLPILLFQGNAKEAMAFYTSLIPGSAVIDVAEYGQARRAPRDRPRRRNLSSGIRACCAQTVW
jgi:predicted 3-demethylubiquinone-9 3-methyltransferase (glyoxalase superfamily)